MDDIISPLSPKAAEEGTSEPVTQPGIQDLPAVEKKLGVALVGLGTYTERQLGPALAETSYCRLAGVVSGDQKKCERWRLRYNLKDNNLYSYENFDEIATNRDIDFVYIALPNAMHAEYVIRAARARKHC